MFSPSSSANTYSSTGCSSGFRSSGGRKHSHRMLLSLFDVPEGK